MLDSVFRAPEYQWARVPHPFGWVGRLWRRLLDLLGSLQSSHYWIFQLLIWTLVAVLAAIVLHAAYVLFLTLRQAGGPADRSLPQPRVRRDAAWYDAEADRLAAAGRYAEALEFAFLGLILQLDQRGVLRFHPSKTPQEYAREVTGRDHRERLARLAALLYRFVFGRVPCGPAEYRAWRQLAGEEWHVAPG